jgi:nucleoside-diphosphate-sugar epimerase
LSLAREAHDVLLIGGDGFLGRPIARALVAAGRRVSVLSRGNRAPVEGA